MFFIMGIGDGSRLIEYHHRLFCPYCGRESGVTVFVVYHVFTLFFVPLFKFGREYYVQFDCCGRRIPLNRETGRKLERGEDILINTEDLEMNSSYNQTCQSCYNRSGASAAVNTCEEPVSAAEDTDEYPVYCGSCGRQVSRTDDICPHCGAVL